MTGGFEVDVARLSRQAGEFPGLADRVSGIAGALRTSLDATGNCWGNDPAGQSFADGHVRPAGSTLDALDALPGRLADVGDRWAATAHAYRQADSAGVDALGRVE
jgi:hypothetical protein